MKTLMSCVLTALITAIVCAVIFGGANQVQEDKLKHELELQKDSTRMFINAYLECNTETKDFNKYLNEPIK